MLQAVPYRSGLDVWVLPESGFTKDQVLTAKMKVGEKKANLIDSIMLE